MTLALVDLVAPHVLGGAALGEPLHELLSALFVQHVDTAFDDEGTTIAGMARFSAELTANPPRYTPPASIDFDAALDVDHRTARHDGAFWDFPDIAIRFRLTAPRASSPAVDTVTGGPGGVPTGQLATAAVGDALARLGQGVPALGQPPQDAPTTVFHLDLLIDAATLHLPYLVGALLKPDGMLEADPDHQDVTLTLPKIKLSVEQTAGTAGSDPQLTISFDSFGALDIDDPDGTAYSELLSMSPAYALIGPDAVVGFGFQSLILDLSGTQTPPALLEKFGVGADFRGVYLPDVRVFVKPPGLDGLAIDISARELLIGIGPEGGLSGIFGVDVVKPDSPQLVGVTVYDEFGAFLVRLEIPMTDPYTAAPLTIPRSTQWVIDVAGGQPPYHITVDGQTQTTTPIVVAVPAGQAGKDVAIVVEDVHAGGQSRHATFPIVVTAPSLTAGQPQVGNKNATIQVITAGPPGYTITMEDHPAAESVTVVFAPSNPLAATLNGTPLSVSGGRAPVPLAHGAQVDITATWTVAAVAAAEAITLNGYFQYAQPPATPNQLPDPQDPAWAAFAGSTGSIRDKPSKDEAAAADPWTAGATALAGSESFATWKAAAQANPAESITIDGLASKEHDPNLAYNDLLSQRRAWAFREFLRGQGVTNAIVAENGLGEQPTGGDYLQPGRGGFRRADAVVHSGGSPAGSAQAAVRIRREPRPQLPVPRKPTVVQRQAPDTPDVRFKELHVRLEIAQNRFVAVELRLKLDFTTVLESYLARVQGDNPGNGPGGTPALPVGKKADPNDGVVDIRVIVSYDDPADRWSVVASMFEDDSDGFLQTPAPSAAGPGTAVEQYWRSFFGVLVALAPLTDAAAASNTPAGDAVALAIAVGIPFAAVQTGVVSVPRITLYGGELTVVHDPTGTRVALLFDVEVALVIQLELGGATLIDTDPTNSITVRYKAVGFKTSDSPQIRDLVPVFDSSKGYTIKIPSTGGIKVPDPLGQILQVAGTRIARSNPVNLELDIELKADLGVVSVDRTTVRIPLEGGHAPTIGALGVHLSVPGAIEGHGYLAIYDDGFAGQLDVSLPSVGIRIAAGLSVRHVTQGDREATAVLITLEVDFPVPIALGASGLGIYGFGGLFALHHKRDENESAPVPALDWLTKVNGNPLDVTGWVPEIDHWAIGLGAVLGTMDSGFTLNVKGMLIFEMPGPRILLVMKAKIISVRPGRQGDVTANILAIIDVDLGRNRITIGLTFDYAIDPLLKIHVPIRAIFPFSDITHFAIDAGTWYAPATVEFFKIFTAKGYLMIRGRGIPDTGPDSYDATAGTPFPLTKPLGGFAIETGVSVSFLWGSKSSGLYLSVGASIDLGIGFSPIMFSGVLKLWGELHLWIIGIEAHAQLSVTAGVIGGDTTVIIDGEVHGSIDLFFFTIEGSVHVTLGDEPDSPPAPPPLITGVSLQSRAAALLQGVSSDRPIDGKLFDAHENAAAPTAETVPIDAIVVLHLDCTPRVKDGAAFTVTTPDGATTAAVLTPVGPAAPAVHRGEPFYTYRITGISLDQSMTSGAVPIVWWPTEPSPGSDSNRELALLTRVPDPHPSSVERSRHQKDLLDQIWSTTCDVVAPPTSVLWTFHDEPLGPSPVGWVVFGAAWPDPPGTTRSQPPNLRIDVAETWRSGNPAVDLLVDIVPATVIGGPVACPEGCSPKLPGQPGVPQLKAVQLPPVVRPGTTLLPLAARAAAAQACWAHVLQAPFLRHTDRTLFADHPLGDVLIFLTEQAEKHRLDQLDDVVAFATGRVLTVRMLLLVPDVLLSGQTLILRTFGADGKVLDETVLDGNGPSSVVTALTDLPKSWVDPDGPWHCRVKEVVTFFTIFGRQKELGMRLLLVDTPVKEGTAYVQVGVRDLTKMLDVGLGAPSYLVGVVETLSAAEVERSDHEQTTKSTQKSEINGALEAMPDPPALLLPTTEYTVLVDYEWATCSEDGDLGPSPTWTPVSQNFRFRTDAQPLAPTTLEVPGGPTQTMPVRLDPWVLLTDPDEGDRFRFWNEPLRVVFSVDYLLTMFATYGVELQARVRAASFKNADPNTPEFAQTVQALDTTSMSSLIGPAVLTPWEDAIREVAESLPCVDTSGSLSRHTVLDLNLLLAPRTDYIFDIEPKDAPAPAPGTSVSPLFRRSFGTSRYGDAEELAGDVLAARLSELPAGDLSGLVALLSAPFSAAALDAALRQAGVRPVVEVTNPEVEVLWAEQGGTLQPRVLIVRTPEPLTRTRKQPDEYEPPNSARLQRKVITLVDKPYLDVRPTPGVAGAATVHLVQEPGVNTVVVVVDAGRNAPIALSLHQSLNPFLGESGPDVDHTLFLATFDAATWEVVD